MDQGIVTLIIFGMVAENITHIFQRGSIFKAARDFFLNKSDLIHDLLNCALCLSFWVSAVLWIGVKIFPQASIIVVIFAVHAVARYIGAAHFWLMKI